MEDKDKIRKIRKTRVRYERIASSNSTILFVSLGLLLVLGLGNPSLPYSHIPYLPYLILIFLPYPYHPYHPYHYLLLILSFSHPYLPYVGLTNDQVFVHYTWESLQQ